MVRDQFGSGSAQEAAWAAASDEENYDLIPRSAADAELERITKAQAPVIRRIFAARATTMAGHAARARSAVAPNPAPMKEGPVDTYEIILHAILRDLIGAVA